MRDLPHSLDLLALGRELLLDELLPLLPAERHRDGHLIATVMAIVAREAAGEEWERGGAGQALGGVLSEGCPSPQPSPRSRGGRERRWVGDSLAPFAVRGADLGLDPGEAR